MRRRPTWRGIRRSATQSDLAQHDFVDYVQDRLASPRAELSDELGFTPRRRLCCTGMPAQIEAAAAGMGLIMAPPYAVPDDGRLVPVLTEFYAERSFWLAAPTDLYRLQRVRAVWNLLREYAEASRRCSCRRVSRAPLRGSG